VLPAARDEPVAVRRRLEFIGELMQEGMGRCRVGTVGHGPPKILVGLASMQFGPGNKTGLYVR